MIIGAFSNKILKIPNLKHFFNDDAKLKLLSRRSLKKCDLVIGWGNKKSGTQAVNYRAKNNIPFLLLEDGFLRSLSIAKNSPAPLALVMDDIGIYYDATQPSRLENLIAENHLTEQEINRAKNLIDFIRQNKLSKYNDSARVLNYSHRDYILVIDQTFGDLSVKGSLADAHSFKKMLEAAIDENKGKKIIVKIHPEVSAGIKEGYLVELAKKYNCIIFDQQVNPWVLIEHALKVYTVSSQLGFEALMGRKEVRCFGMPFYAGWGLTNDEISIDRRKSKKSIYDLFNAAYIKYTTYLNPFTMKQCPIEEILPILKLFVDTNEENREINHLLHISSWKKKAMRNFFRTTTAVPEFIKKINKVPYNKTTTSQVVGAWASKITFHDEQAAKNRGILLARIEDGFIRSVGLGANLISPQSIVVDFSGIYYDYHHPSDLENLIANYKFDEELLIRAKNLIERINLSNITKYNLNNCGSSGGGSNTITLSQLPADKKKILVIGQVEDDASIKLGTKDIKNNLDLIKEVRKCNPNSYIIYKPHPDVVAGQRKGKVSSQDINNYVDCEISNCSITDLLVMIDELHTMTSLAGFEALLRGKKVHCYGMPFYAGWGLTEDRFSCSRRFRKIRLEELVGAALILYPRYLDPISNLPCTPEVMIQKIYDIKDLSPSFFSLVKLRRLWGKIKILFRLT